jgi:hypothetical protein
MNGHVSIVSLLPAINPVPPRSSHESLPNSRGF